MSTRLRYAAAALVLLLIEGAIALWVHDALVRPYLGDSLAVILVYLALRAATPLRVGPAVTMALAVAVAIEIGQGLDLVDALGLGGSPVARILLGTGFDPVDFLAYAGGALAVIAVERIRRRGGISG